MGKRLQITLDQLQAAWQRRHRSDWPATFTEAMAHPLLRGLVRAEALRQALASQRAEQQPRWHPPHSHPLQSRPPVPTRPAKPQPDLFDRKRAAAGDRDD